jgi:microcystin-dependent protein
VGEIKTFAVGADSTDLINQLATQGWVEAAGQSAIRKDFDELWKIVGADWGSPDKFTFFLPDLRGLMLRGWNHGKTAAAGYAESPYAGEPPSLAGARVAPRPEIPASVGSQGSTGNHVGSLESDMVGSHDHAYTRNNTTYHLANDDHATQNIWGDENKQARTSASGGPETHPPNAYVMYFIYVGKPAQIIEPTAKEKEDPLTSTGRIKCYKDAKEECKTKL